MFDPVAFLRIVLFASLFGGLEYRYVNRNEAKWTKEVDGFYERPVLSKYTAYHLSFLLPIFIVVSFTFSPSAWAGNVFLSALVEDVAYFFWRKKWVVKGEWTTQLFGSFSLGGLQVPVWWPLDMVIVALFYLTPFI